MTQREARRVLKLLEATTAYVVALRQCIYSANEQYRGANHMTLLDVLSQAEWPERERMMKELEEQLS